MQFVKTKRVLVVITPSGSKFKIFLLVALETASLINFLEPFKKTTK